MGMVTARTELTDILTKVLLSIPDGFVFDEVYIVDQLSSEYPDKYLNFCTLHGDREDPMEMVVTAIRGVIEQFEGVLVEEQNLNIKFLTLYGYIADHNSITDHKLWKKI